MSTTLLAILAALITTGGTLAAQRFLHSGKVGTSQAADLWQASTDLRRDLMDRDDRLYSRIHDLEAEVEQNRRDHAIEIEVLRRNHLACETALAELRARIDRQ